MAVVAAEAFFIYAVGIRIQLPRVEAQKVGTQVAQRLQAEWPTLRVPLYRAMKPLVAAEVKRMVAEVTVDVGGVRVALPASLQTELSRDINRILLANLNQYLSHGLNPQKLFTGKMVNYLLAKPWVLHLWVHVWGIPVPVAVRVGGSS